MRNPTLHDVARAAGVSYSTADRVLNERGGVAEKSVQRVLQAIQQLDYRRDIHAANLSRRRSYRFCCFIPRGSHGFFSVLRDALVAEAEIRARDRVSITVHDVPALDGDALAAALNGIAPDTCDCVAIMGVDSAALTAAMGRLRRIGIQIVTLVSDTAPELRDSYIGIDNIVAGRTAGRLIRLAHGGGPGRILPVLGSLGVRDHRDRHDGAAQALAQATPPLTLLPPIEVYDSPDAMQDRLGRVLADDPHITAIYSIGAGNRALIDLMSRRQSPRPFVVLHELTAHSRAALQGDLVDAVIDQKPAEEISRALNAMRRLADGRQPRPIEITPTIFFKENLPALSGTGANK